MSASEMELTGEWVVYVDEDYPDMVKMQMTEINDKGVDQEVYLMPPDIADDFADQIKLKAAEIRENRD